MNSDIQLKHIKFLTFQSKLKHLHSDLSNRSVFPKNIVHFLRCDLIRQVPNVQDPVDFWRQPDLVQKQHGTLDLVRSLRTLKAAACVLNLGANITEGARVLRCSFPHPPQPQIPSNRGLPGGGGDAEGVGKACSRPRAEDPSSPPRQS